MALFPSHQNRAPRAKTERNSVFSASYNHELWVFHMMQIWKILGIAADTSLTFSSLHLFDMRIQSLIHVRTYKRPNGDTGMNKTGTIRVVLRLLWVLHTLAFLGIFLHKNIFAFYDCVVYKDKYSLDLLFTLLLLLCSFFQLI